jgi:hypothetical protein
MTDRLAEGFAADARCAIRPVEEVRRRPSQKLPLGRMARARGNRRGGAVPGLAARLLHLGRDPSMDGAADRMVV